MFEPQAEKIGHYWLHQSLELKTAAKINQHTCLEIFYIIPQHFNTRLQFVTDKRGDELMQFWMNKYTVKTMYKTTC